MKILLLTSYPTSQLFELNKCKNRYQVYGLSIYNYFKNYDNVELILSTVCPPGRTAQYNSTINKLKLPEVDHTILVAERGFKARNSGYIQKIREITRGKIISIGASGIHKGGEDEIFYLRKGITDSPCCLDFPVDEEIICPKQTKHYLTILISEYSCSYIPYFVQKDTDKKKCYDRQYLSKEYVDLIKNHQDQTVDILKNVKEFTVKNNEENLILVKQFDRTGVHIFDNVSQTDRHVDIKDMDHYYQEIMNTNIFFVTNKNVDPILLYELGMANVIIVAPINLINKKVVDDLEIIEYQHKIPWSSVFEKLDHCNVRDKLIQNGHTWRIAVDQIYGMLSNNRELKDLVPIEVKKKRIATQKKLIYRAPKTQWEVKHEKLMEEKKIKEEEDNKNKKPEKKLRVFQNFRS